MEGLGELLLPRFLWSKGGICKGLMPSLQAALGCSGGEAALPLPQAPSAFSPQRSVTVFDSSVFCRFHGIIPHATPNHCSQPHDVAMDALYCFKESWEGNKILGTLQIKFLPEQSKQLLEALGYRNWWEASGPLSDAGAALASHSGPRAQTSSLVH